MKKQNVSYFLIPGSLLLLASFLGYWLYGAYHKEQAQLKTEIKRTIIDSKRTIQDSLIQNLFAQSLQNHNSSDSFQLKNAYTDINGTTEIQILSSTEVLDSVDYNAVRRIIKYADPRELQANISIVMDQDSSFSEGIYTGKMQDDFTQLILDKVVQDLHRSKFPKEFSILNKDSAKLSTNKIAIKVFNKSDQDNYVASFDGVHWHLLKKIFPQILFSCLLLSMTCLAFYVVHQSLQEQKNLLAMKNNFISNMTHELKTPISTIGVAIEAMQDFDVLKDSEKTKEYLAFSKTELGRLSLLVEKVLNMAKFENGNYALKKENIYLEKLISKVLDSMQLQLKKAGAEVSINYDKQASYKMNGDPIHLSNVIYNLIDNSLKYSKSTAQISIELKEESNQIILNFSDHGIGIPSAFQTRVFDQFFRVPTGNIHNIKGHGLGLSYVAEIIQKHQGSISLKSKEGEGSHFKISFPKA